MRKPNEEDLSDEAADVGSVGAGFGGSVDLSEDSYYGDSFDSDYTDESNGSRGDDADGSFDDSDGGDGGPDTEEAAFGEEVTEAEAEAILEDMLDDTYGSDAGALVEDLEQSTGMSAVEILEDITGLDLGDNSGSDEVTALDGTSGGIGSVDPFEAPESPELDMATSSDFDLNRDGHVDVGDAHEAAHLFDYDVTD